MGASWSSVTSELRTVLLASVVTLKSPEHPETIACTVYSLGIMGAQWDSLPAKVGVSCSLLTVAVAVMSKKREIFQITACTLEVLL